MTPNTRKHNESFDAYKARRTIHNKLDKVIGKGRLIWDSIRQGTYRKDKHGPIGGA